MTNISKNIETLEESYAYKEFVDSVSSKTKRLDIVKQLAGKENRPPNKMLKTEPTSPLKLSKQGSVDKTRTKGM